MIRKEMDATNGSGSGQTKEESVGYKESAPLRNKLFIRVVYPSRGKRRNKEAEAAADLLKCASSCQPTSTQNSDWSTSHDKQDSKNKLLTTEDDRPDPASSLRIVWGWEY